MTFEDAEAYLVGEPHKGMSYMFTMMNAARLAVGVQAMALGETAYQTARQYAMERLQGRALKGAKFPAKPADPLIVHPDIRRMLLTMRAYTEGARALAGWVSLALDRAERHPDPERREEAEDLVALMTPIIKALFTDNGFAVTNLGVQIMGGHGYIRESGVEQLVRDCRITQIYEGANGIQALDLVGRKLGKDGGRAIMAFFNEVQTYLKERANNDAMNAYLKPLGQSLAHLQEASMWFMQNAMAKPDNAGAGSYDYMHLFGLVALGYMWCLIAEAAIAKKGNGAAPGMDAKLVTARFFMDRLLPETATRLARIKAGAGSTMELPDDAF
jgi:hypothetical protein